MSATLFSRMRSGMRSVFLTAAVACLVAACSHVPLTTMVKLSRFDLLKTAPEGLRIAVKYPDSIQIPENGARMRLTVKDKSSGEVRLREDLAFVRVDARDEKVELASELQTGWRVEVYRLPENKVAAFKSFQAYLVSMSDADREKVEGSMDLSVDACLVAPTRPDRIVVSTFLKASEFGGFVPLLRDADLDALMAAEGLDGDRAPLGPCPGKKANGLQQQSQTLTTPSGAASSRKAAAISALV